MPLVSRYFSETCRDPSLCPELCMNHASFQTEVGWQSFLRWLAVRAPGLHTFVFGHIKAGVRIQSFVMLPQIQCGSSFGAILHRVCFTG